MREMVVELNEFEAKLLYLLDLDCRKSSTQLAKKLKTSPQRIEYTINKFEKDGVIIRYSAVIDYSKLGSYTYYGYKIKFEIMDKKERLNLFEEIAQHKKCAFFYQLQGRWDALIGTIAEDVYEAEENLNELLSLIKEKIKKKEFFVFTKIHNHGREYLFSLIKEKNKEELMYESFRRSLEIIGDSDKKQKYDETDLKIIKFVSDNAKEKIVNIAKKLKLKPETIWYRLKNLQKNGVIIRYGLTLQPSSYKHLFYFLEIKLKKFDKREKEQIILFLKKFENVWRIIELVENRIFSFLMCSKEEEMNWIIEELENNFSKTIDETEINKIVHLYTFRFFF